MMILAKGATTSIRYKKMGFILVSLSLFKFPFLIQCLPSTFNFQVHVWPLESISTVQTSQTNEHLGNSTKGNWSDNDWDHLCQSRLDLQILFWKHSVIIQTCQETLNDQSKHLKGQLGPPVSDVTFFNHGGRLGPPLVTSRFLIMEVGWGPPLVTSRFLIIEVSWAPPLVTSRFLIMEVGWGPVLVTSRFLIMVVSLDPVLVT